MLQLQISQFGKCKYGRAETEAVSKILWHTHTQTHAHTLTETAQWRARLGWGHVVNKIKLKRKNYKSRQAQRKPKINQIKVLFKQQYNTTIRV